MNILSLFDGISAGQVALNRADVKYENYFASEIDKNAIFITQKNFPNTKQLGNVEQINAKKLPKIDLLIGGSPCQSFSSLGDGSGFDGKSRLFWEYLRIYNELKKKNNNLKFLLENVVMKEKWSNIITDKLNIEPILINSNIVSAQNRPRLYWSNINFIEYGFLKSKKTYFEIEKKKILLKDILEDREFREIPKGFFNKWGNKMRIEKGLNWTENKKSNCLTTKNCHSNQYLLNLEKNKIRTLTPIEFERLQTFDDNYTEGISNTERFKALGNSWTVDVISEIFKYLK